MMIDDEMAKVIHAKWVQIPHKNDRECGNCGHDEPYKNADHETDIFNYCPFCGAKMDLKFDT